MHEDYLHSETLGAIYYGLSKVKKLTSIDVEGILREIKNKILKFLNDGILKKMKKGEETLGVDSSSLLLFSEFGVFSSNSTFERKIIEKTLNKIHELLSPNGIGLRRFWITEWGNRGKDTYFGGGVWCVTTLWAGEVHLILGDKEKTDEILQYFDTFPFPEQITEKTFNKDMLNFWKDKTKRESGGKSGPANPLAWSHATWIDLFLKFKKL